MAKQSIPSNAPARNSPAVTNRANASTHAINSYVRRVPGRYPRVILLGLLARLVRWFVDGEIEAADTSVADLVVRFSILAAVIVTAIWLFLRF